MIEQNASAATLCPQPGTLRAPCAILLGIAMLLLCSCGYRAGLAPTLGGGRVTRTIGIEIFGNESQLPNLERQLHAAMSDAARRHTSLELVSPARADLVIRGAIEGFQRSEGARTGDNRLVETQENIIVAAEIVDGARGVTVGRTSTSVGFGTAIDVPGREPAARDNALRNSADRILLTLLAGLEYGVVRPGDPGSGLLDKPEEPRVNPDTNEPR